MRSIISYYIKDLISENNQERIIGQRVASGILAMYSLLISWQIHRKADRSCMRADPCFSADLITFLLANKVL